MRITNLILQLITVFVAIAATSVATAQETSEDKAQRIFERITGGISIHHKDPRFKQMVDFINLGEDEQAAAIATEDPYFYQVTVKNTAAAMSNRALTPFVPLDDFQATFIGAVRDDLDARTLLYGNYIYRDPKVEPPPSRRDNRHYEAIDDQGSLYKTVLVKQEPQWEGMKNHSGLLTTRAWAKAHYNAGTNRRSVVFAFQEFLCQPIDNWKVAGLPPKYIGRDVERSPGKDSKVFDEQCRTCHGGMDAMRDAFSQMDYVSEGFVELPEGRVAPKYSRGATTYPEGHVTKDDAWQILIAMQNMQIGFKGPLSGSGVQSFGESLANTEAFKECMAKKVFTTVCQREPDMRDLALITVAARNFERNDFNLKRLFQDVAIQPGCIGE